MNEHIIQWLVSAAENAKVLRNNNRTQNSLPSCPRTEQSRGWKLIGNFHKSDDLINCRRDWISNETLSNDMLQRGTGSIVQSLSFDRATESFFFSFHNNMTKAEIDQRKDGGFWNWLFFLQSLRFAYMRKCEWITMEMWRGRKYQSHDLVDHALHIPRPPFLRACARRSNTLRCTIDSFSCCRKRERSRMSALKSQWCDANS